MYIEDYEDYFKKGYPVGLLLRDVGYDQLREQLQEANLRGEKIYVLGKRRVEG